MPIPYKSKLSSAIANATFLDKTIDDIKKGKLTLYKINIGDTETIDDVQSFINEISDTQGTTEGDANRKNYANENFISNGDSQKTTIEKLDAQAKINRDDIDSNDIELLDHETRISTNESDISQNQTDISQNVLDITQNSNDITSINNSIDAPNGICPLDNNTKVPIANIPDSLIGAVIYQGTWDANTNTPDLTLIGSKGFYYAVSVSGNTNLDGITDWNAKDVAIHNGTSWEKIDNTDNVLSVNGYTGNVSLNNSDIGLGSVTNDSQLKRSSGDLNAFTEKLAPVINDIVIIEDSEDSFSKKKVKLENMLGGGGSGGGSFQWELGDIAPLEEFKNFLNVLSFEYEINNSIHAMVVVPAEYKLTNQITLKNALFFSQGSSGKVLFRLKTTLIKIGEDITSVTNQYTSTNSELTLTTSNALASVGDMLMTDGAGEINNIQVAPLDILILELYRDTTNETVNSTEYASFIKYSASVDFNL